MHPIRALSGLAALLVAAALIGCTNTAVDSPTVQARLTQPYQGDVGKTMWAQYGLYACSTAGLGGQCAMLPGKSKFQIVGVTEGTISTGGTTISDGNAYYQLQLADGRTVYANAPLIGTTDVDPDVAAAECKRKGAPHIGMTYKQVEATCWGKPDHVNRSETAGAIHDQYVYGDSRYVYLSNGIVTSIQTSGTVH